MPWHRAGCEPCCGVLRAPRAPAPSGGGRAGGPGLIHSFLCCSPCRQLLCLHPAVPSPPSPANSWPLHRGNWPQASAQLKLWVSHGVGGQPGSSAPPPAALGLMCFPTPRSAAPAAVLTPRLASVGIFRLFFGHPSPCSTSPARWLGSAPPMLAGTCRRAGGCADLPPLLPPPRMARLSQPRGEERLIHQLLPPNLTLTSKQRPLLAHPGNPQPQISTRPGGAWVRGSAPRGDGGVCPTSRSQGTWQVRWGPRGHCMPPSPRLPQLGLGLGCRRRGPHVYKYLSQLCQ